MAVSYSVFQFLILSLEVTTSEMAAGCKGCFVAIGKLKGSYR